MSGRVYLVGAGPGDPGLITVRGRELLGAADVVVYDRLVSERLLELAAPDAELIYVGKKASEHTCSQEQINHILIDHAGDGADVVRLKGGDPFVFGRGGEEALALAAEGIEFEVVPGLTAGSAAPAYAGIPVTHRHLASSVAFVTGHESADKDSSALDWDALARWEGTLVFYMGVGNLRPICSRLVAEGLSEDTPAAIIRWGTLPRQRTLAATVSSLPDIVEEAGLEPPALIVVGSVVSLRQELSWFERRPLFGRRIVVTRSRARSGQFAARLEALGAEVVQMPTFRIEPPRDRGPLLRAAQELERFDWLVLTSVNGVDALFGALEEVGLDARALASSKICAIGPATARRLAAHGIRADVLPPRYTSNAIVQTLADREELRGSRVLCPRADIAPADMVEALVEHGARVEEVTAYRNVAEAPDPDRVATMFRNGQVDYLTFTSSSTVRNFLGAADGELIRSSPARIATIGPVTSATVREYGLTPHVEAESHTIDGLVESIIEAEEGREVIS